MVTFYRTISQPEVNSTYLNLTDDSGRKHGAYFGLQHKQRIVIKDGAGRITYTKMHHRNQIWGSISEWFYQNNVQAGLRTKITHDPSERHENLPVIHLIPEGEGNPAYKVEEEAEVTGSDTTPEIPLRFEKQLEDFLAANPEMVEPGLKLYRDEDGRIGRQYPTEVGLIDLICQRPNGEFLVLELKRWRGSDVVVGQISRYIGWVKKHLAGEASVYGLILTHEKDETLKYAVYANSSISLKYYKVHLDFVEENEL
ncbi:MAG: endonuclease NucS domain-containing protein [Planctomycetota bacterium]|jgi:hypothetical protein